MSGRAEGDDGWWRDFVMADPPRTAKLAVTAASGQPLVAPVWVLLDGDDIVFTTGVDTVKGKAMARDPRVALCWDDDRPPFQVVMLQGRAALSDDLEEVRRWAALLGARYMGAARAEEYGTRNGVPGELLVRVTPTRITALRDVAN
jgi:PPOX class probable F420-dependent enzyme